MTAPVMFDRVTPILHLSEHHGDSSPAVRFSVSMQGVEAFRNELAAKKYRYMRPGLEKTPWNTLTTTLTDPFGNRITFNEPLDPAAG